MIDWGARADALLRELAAHSEPGAGVTRLPFTPEHRGALDLLRMRMEQAGLSVSLDDAGTLIGRQEGPRGSGVFLLGSHQDSIRQGGAFDGIMGVVLPILALEKLRAEGVGLPFAVEVLAFADEEGIRFPTALVGSRALAGTCDMGVLDMQDAQGVTLRDAMAMFGLNPDGIVGLRRAPEGVVGFLETHIEQGPVLEREGEAMGVVTAICGIERHRLSLAGETGHAGTMPMEGRRDALVGAAAIVSEVNRIANDTADLRATVGSVCVEPNVVNAVPRAVRLGLEIRSPCDRTRRAAGEEVKRFAAKISSRLGLEAECVLTYEQPARPCCDALSDVLRRAVVLSGGRGLCLPSGATHDASAMADLCPVAMLFVRCRGGVSHRPEERAAAEDMGRAIAAIAAFLSSVAPLDDPRPAGPRQ